MSTRALVDEVVRVISQIPAMPDDAAWVHGRVISELSKCGFSVEAEFPINYAGGKHGRIDIVAGKSTGRVAIEIDARNPRRKSIQKLQAFNGGRVIALRGVSAGYAYQDIDAVTKLKVRQCRRSEKADKRRVSKAMQEIRP